MVFVGYGVQAPEFDWDDYKGHRPARQDDGRADRRPAGGRCRRSPAALDPTVFGGTRDDLLRALDVQVRDGAEDGRGRRAHRSRDRAGRLRVPGRAGEGGRAVRHRAPRRQHDAGRGRGLDPAREGEGAVRDGGEGLRRREGARGDARVPAGAARCHGVGHDQEPAAPGVVAQRGRESGGERPGAEGRVRALHVALGRVRHRRAARTATRSTTARWTTPWPSPVSSRSRAPSRRSRRRRVAASCSPR